MAADDMGGFSINSAHFPGARCARIQGVCLPKASRWHERVDRWLAPWWLYVAWTKPARNLKNA
jgi:hypothetical protein